MTQFVIRRTQFTTAEVLKVVYQQTEDTYTLVSVIEECVHKTLKCLKIQHPQSFSFPLLLDVR